MNRLAPQPRRRRLVCVAVVLIAAAIGLLLRLGLHRTVPCGSGMSPLVPSACAGPPPRSAAT
jgi:TRAP-type C4-dicarboxylate transport system permease small subunit